MGGRFWREPVSLLALSIAIAAQSAQAAAQDGQPASEGASVGPAAGAEVTEPQPASLAPPDGEVFEDVSETIVVTGSRIPRPDLTAVSPVTVVGQEEVKLEGATFVEELLNNLPQVAPSQGAFIANGATGTATLDLRNLGASRTLVLINGRRLGPGDPTSPVADVNIVPSTLIQRVEVLTGGASSVYGSDAVSGVVNFILDTRLEGLLVDGQASVFHHDNRNESGIRSALEARGFPYPSGHAVDGGRQDINAALGKSFFDGRAHVTLYAGYRHIDGLTQSARDYSACTTQVMPSSNDILRCGGSFASFPGNFATNFDVFQIGPDRTFVPGIDTFNFGPWNHYQRPSRRYTAGGFADAEISPAVNPYVEVMYMNDRSVAQIAPSAAFGVVNSINCDSPLLSDQQRALVCFPGNFVGEVPDNQGNISGSPIPFTDPVTGDTYFRGVLQILRRNLDSGPRQIDLRHETLRLLGGTKGELGRGINYDASYMYGRADLSSTLLNDLWVSRLRRALDVVTDPESGGPICRSSLIARELGPTAPGADAACVPWDVFELGAVTPAATAYFAVPASSEGSVTEKVANANATFDLAEWDIRSPWADSSPAFNFGAEYRKNTLEFIPDELAQSGDLAGGFQELPVNGSVDVKELFAEARIPLVSGRVIEEFSFEGGYRQSWYDNSQSSFSTNAYKAAIDLIPVRGLRFRASHQRAVRAPNVVELFTPIVPSFLALDPCEGPAPQATQAQCAFTGVSAAQYGNIIAIPESLIFQGYNARTGGNPDLEPEEATTRTVGVVLEPRFLGGFSATIDWWDIELKGAIQNIGPLAIMETCIATGDPFFCSRIHRDSSGSLWLTPEGFVDDRQANIGALDVRGLDVAVSYGRDIGGFGSMSASFLGSYLDQYVVDNGGLSAPLDCAGKFGFVCANPVPRWRHKARLTWEPREGLSVSAQWRHTGKMSLEPVPGFSPPGPLSRLPSRSYFDLSALFRFRRDFVFRTGVNNIFDTEPPIIPVNEGGCPGGPCNGNTYPQWYDPLGRYIFAGFTIAY